MRKLWVCLSSLLLMMALTNGFAETTHGHKHERAAAATASTSVNINTANVQTLEGLKGIGPKRAQAIVDYRNEHGEFKSIDDLANVKGISAKSLDRLEKNNPGRMVLR